MGAEPDARHSYQIPHLTDVIALCASAPRVPRLNPGEKKLRNYSSPTNHVDSSSGVWKKNGGKHCHLSLNLFFTKPML